MTAAASAFDFSDRAPLRRAWLAAAGWSGLAVVEALALHYQWGVNWTGSAVSAVLDYSTMGVLTWAVCMLNRRLEIWNRPAVRALPVYLALVACAAVAWWSFKVGFLRVLMGPPYWDLAFAESWMFQITSGAFAIAAAVGLGITIQAFDREHERREREVRFEVAARDLELEALKGQLRPHFLLNSLNSVLALVDDDPAAARGMIERLSSLLQMALEGLDEPLVPLERELDLMRDYLEVERVRFGDRLRYAVHLDGAPGDVLVPPLLLHPLVENAVRHGIEPSPRPGEVCVRVSRAGARLAIRIVNSVDAAHAGRPGTGRGLDLTRRRLRTAYGDASAALTAGREDETFVAVLDLPVQVHVV
jgi:two-component system, LytTR family, sensor histidine kinase AlgZ